MRVRASLLLLAVALAGCHRASSRPPLARAKGAWFWHSPIALDRAQSESLTRLGITEIYPLVGTFANDGERLILHLRRSFTPIPAGVGVRRVHLTYRFDTGAVHHALDEEPTVVARAIARAFAEDWGRAQAGAWEVVGLQLDLDCPTRRLARYGEILAALRRELPAGMLLSVTGLGDWLNGNVATPLKSVDFWCPQLYEFETPRLLADLKPLSSAGRLSEYRPKLEALDVPYRIGIAAHGQALLYRDGRLDGTAQGLAPADAARLYWAEPSVLPAPDEERAAYRIDAHRVLLFRRPDPRSVLRAIAAENGGAGMDAGFVLFRVPEPGEELTPSLETLAHGPEPRDVMIETREGGDPFAAIEGGAHSVDRAITVSFRSGARTTPPLATDGVQVRLDFAPGSLESIVPGDFPNLRLVDAEGRGPVSLARAAAAIGTAPGLPVGKPLLLGPIVKKSGKIRVVARVRGYGREATAEKEL